MSEHFFYDIRSLLKTIFQNPYYYIILLSEDNVLSERSTLQICALGEDELCSGHLFDILDMKAQFLVSFTSRPIQLL